MNETQKEFLTVLGYFFIQAGKFDKALVLFKALKEFSPDDDHIMKSLSYLFLVAGENEEALEWAEKYLARQTEDSETGLVHLLKGRSLWRLGRKEEAQGLITRMLATRGIR